MQIYQSKNITSADADSTVTLCNGGGVLAHITINKTSAHALTINDVHQGRTTQIGVIKASVAEQTLTYMVAFTGSLQIAVPASYVGDATVSFKPL